MAGTLVATTLSDGTNSTSTTNAIRGSAKAWVQFDGTTGAIVGAFNVGSVTRTGTGFYSVNFTTAMPDANYSAVTSGTVTYGGAGTGTVALDDISATPITAGTVKILSRYSTIMIDAAKICVSVFR